MEQQKKYQITRYIFQLISSSEEDPFANSEEDSVYIHTDEESDNTYFDTALKGLYSNRFKDYKTITISMF